MTGSWEQLESLFHLALAADPAQRQKLLAANCHGDAELFREAASLVQAFEANTEFLKDSAFDLGLTVFGGQSQEESLQGRTIGIYQIKQKIGEGGMGDVYLAEDTRLEREVALKFLNADLFDDTTARRQLIKEGRAVAMLDHANICAVHAVEEIDGYQFIVMQYVEGQTLSELIVEGSIDSDQVLPLIRQIVDAIVAAHAHGIIHRDIKPGNIMLTTEGQVKVLDFGLAKIVEHKNKGGILEQRLSQPSQRGSIRGTIAYMSPEQLKAEKLDYRSDIFSLGTLICELATGRNPFEGESDAETIAAILKPENGLNRSIGGLSRPLRRVTGKCLQKERDRRYQSASELLLDLQAPVEISRSSVLFSYLGLLIGLAVMAAIAVVLFYHPSERLYKTAVLPFTNETADSSLDYLADGMAEDLITKLSSSYLIRPQAYSLVQGYRQPDLDRVAVGRALQADLVLTGRISRENDQFLLKIDLVDTGRGVSIRRWENAFRLTEISQLEDDVVNGILKEVTSERIADRRRATRENGEAFRQYLVGRYYWRQLDPKNLEAAIAAFQNSIELDPSFSRSYAGLADSYVLLSLAAYGGVPREEAMTKARAAAKQALEIDPNSAEAHTSLGVVLAKYDWNWQQSEREYRRAITLDADYAPAHYWLSSLLAILGRAEDSVSEAKIAKKLDPFSPLIDLNLARNYYYGREYDEAIEVLSAPGAVRRQNDPEIRYLVGLVYVQKGMYNQASAIFEDLSSENRSLGTAALGYTYAKLGRRADAEKLITELERISKGNDRTSREIAILYAGLNEKDKAFLYLERAIENRSCSVIDLKVEPLFDSIRSDPRFAQLLRKISLN